MKTLRRKRKQSRQTLDSRIAAAKTPHQKRTLAFYGTEAEERKNPLVALALEWRTLRSEQKDGKLHPALYRQAKANLEFHTLSAMLANRPETFDELARVMRKVNAGKFDPRIDRDRAEILAREAQGNLNISQLAKELAPSVKSAQSDAVSGKERALRRIKARILPKSHPDK